MTWLIIACLLHLRFPFYVTFQISLNTGYGLDKRHTRYIQWLYMQTQTFNIALPKDLVKRVDLVAKKEYKNRSELIREALRIYLVKLETWESIFKAGREAAKKAGIKSEKQIDDLVYEFRHGRKPA